MIETTQSIIKFTENKQQVSTREGRLVVYMILKFQNIKRIIVNINTQKGEDTVRVIHELLFLNEGKTCSRKKKH